LGRIRGGAGADIQGARKRQSDDASHLVRACVPPPLVGLSNRFHGFKFRDLFPQDTFYWPMKFLLIRGAHGFRCHFIDTFTRLLSRCAWDGESVSKLKRLACAISMGRVPLLVKLQVLAQVPAILLEDEFKKQNQCEHDIKQARDPSRTYPKPAHHNFNLGGLKAAENQ
jgi:hypothetical protein